MTKQQKDHGGVHSPVMACYHAVHDYKGGSPVISSLLGISQQVLNKKLKNTGSHVLTLEESMHILRITEDTRILDAICAEAGVVWFTPDEVPTLPSDMDVLGSSTHLMGRTMSLITELQNALDDGQIDSLERARMNKCALDLQQQLNHFIELSKQFEAGGES
ncbi:MAG: hypothetical protein AXW15_05815 [Neptuniibacter sp. Phe_28]|jgi:hypothetical protein|nr:MAG: hypothetical protein AXW15_05815 [Neptuniibacter sp. Phe_28]